MNVLLFEIALWITGIVYIRRYGITRGAEPDWVAIVLWQPVLLIYSLLGIRNWIAARARG